MTKNKKLTLFVSSTVYENRKLLDQLYPILTSFGYEVWMSHKGTVPVNPGENTFQSCLRAAERCDLFFGIITPSYGSGIGKIGPSIIHQEIKRAIKLDKPRWCVVHSEVVFARRLLRDLGHDTPAQRKKLQLKPGAKSIADLRVIDMYEDAMRHDEPDLAMRTGNWVQEFNSDNDVLLFVETQLSRIDEIKRIIKENIATPKTVQAQPKKRKGGAK